MSTGELVVILAVVAYLTWRVRRLNQRRPR